LSESNNGEKKGHTGDKKLLSEAAKLFLMPPLGWQCRWSTDPIAGQIPNAKYRQGKHKT